ncbi:MAG: GNAT family N-acetyltransferase [Bdellovibrionota bacterium]
MSLSSRHQFRIIISPLNDIPLGDIKHVYQECRWGWSSDDLAVKALRGSFKSVIVYDGDSPVGFCRSISDGVAYALVVDTMVVPAYQKKGIGTLLMKTLIDSLKQSGVGFIKLISSKEGKDFYEKLGFKARSQDEPGMMMSLL